MDSIYTYEEIMRKLKLYVTKKSSHDLVTKAFNFMMEKHAGQFRKSGEPYSNHLIAVACILADLHAGPTTIAAGLLHDTIEDCAVCFQDIEREFSLEIAQLVEAVTKVTQLSNINKEDYLAENHRKIFIAMAKDIRVIIIKLADRLHNMRTLEFQKVEKQKQIAKETLEVYTPIAHRLGLNTIKTELENLCLYYLDREKYLAIEKLLQAKEEERHDAVELMETKLKKLLDKNKLPYQMSGRAKSIYSIYKKMYVKGRDFAEIYDLQALRIITKTKTHCYEILGYIHATYRPIPGRFKDYIAMPKPNMYQSLHTSIIAEDGEIFEIQIRTKEMDEVAESGVAAHWKYKENKGYDASKEQKEIEEKLHWFRDFVALSDEELHDGDAKEYMNSLTHDIFEANVYCLTPKGRVIDLPNGATPIDFAYKIHTQVGHTMIGAIVNGTMVPLSTVLKTGDVVDIKTNKNTGPSEGWLHIAKTSYALNHIRKYLLKQNVERNRDDYILNGKMYFEIACKDDGLNVTECLDFLSDEKNKKYLPFDSIEDMFLAIGQRHITAGNITSKIKAEKRKEQQLLETTQEALNRQKKYNRENVQNNSGIIVEGLDRVAITMAQCCSPIPGDEIVGYISKGLGIKVHRADCPNIINEQKRLINVYWADETDDSTLHPVSIQVKATDRPNLLMDIVNNISQLNINIQNINGHVVENTSFCYFDLNIKVKNINHLRLVINSLYNISDVISISRLTKN